MDIPQGILRVNSTCIATVQPGSSVPPACAALHDDTLITAEPEILAAIRLVEAEVCLT
jgi:hypothetical protein